ncbi:MAG: zinc-ribbon domain-containing protein [Lachnospiraceae bacterium]|nr:zinc-ribbon domain-containing protein [Lachnospiraceae bacterium]
MYCTNCGKLVDDNAVICPSCGFNIAGAAQQSSMQQVPQVPLEPPMPLNNGISQDQPVQQNYDPNAGAYQNQQNFDPNAGGYQYQQNYDPNAGGYQYQQNYDPNAGGYQYQQNYNQNMGGYGYYEGLNAASPEQQWNGGAAGQPGAPAHGAGGALACGIISIVIGFLGGIAFGVIGAGIGIALGMVGLILAINFRKANNGGANGGLVTSIIGLILSAVLFVSCAACQAVCYGTSSTKNSRNYGCYGCIGGTCLAVDDIGDTVKSYDFSDILDSDGNFKYEYKYDYK